MKLLIDIGNTRLKSALWDGRALRIADAIVHAGDLAYVDFMPLWKDIERAETILVASVAGAAIDQYLADSVRGRFQKDPVFFTSPAAAYGVRNAYAEPTRLGIDRFLGLIALHADTRDACVLAGCGTALTLDALAADGTHLGGLIAPSPPLMLDALTGAAARLAKPQAARIVEMADNTADAMQSGAWLAAAALVERFVDRASARFGSAPSLVLTGGGAERLGGLIAPAHRIDADVVLRGLALYADSLS